MSITTNASADLVGRTRTKLLAWWLPHAALVAGLLVVGRGAGSNGHLDRRPRLDGRGMHPQCAALRTDALPVHRAVLSLYDYSGALARAGCRSGRPIRMASPRRLHYPRRQNDMVGDGARAGKVLVDCGYQYRAPHATKRRWTLRNVCRPVAVCVEAVVSQGSEPLTDEVRPAGFAAKKCHHACERRHCVANRAYEKVLASAHERTHNHPGNSARICAPNK